MAGSDPRSRPRRAPDEQENRPRVPLNGPRVGVVGAGWAGLAAAVRAREAGWAVTLFEATRVAGGRARRVDLELPDGRQLALDNGQHILIGAYTHTLALMRTIGLDPDALLLRQPLSLTRPGGHGLRLPRTPRWLDVNPPLAARLALLVGVLLARGWTIGDKLGLLRTASRWRDMEFSCPPGTTVADLCKGMRPRVRAQLIEPLCLSALNVPPARADGEVFLRVLHDALFEAAGGSDLLLPRTDLGELLPTPALRWLTARAAELRFGRRVQEIARSGHEWTVDGEPFGRVVLALPAWEAARLVAPIHPDWARTAADLRHEAIATVYVQAERGLHMPMLALDEEGQFGSAQFVFDRGRLGARQGLLAFVVSACEAPRETIEAQVLRQAATQLKLKEAVVLRTVIEKRATFSCTPEVPRPPALIAPGLSACGDYVDGPYPSTIEGAVRSGEWALKLPVARHPDW